MKLDRAHRVPRFFSSLRPGPPTRPDLEWAFAALSDREQKLFLRMSNPDQRHAVRVARRVEEAYGGLIDPAVPADVALVAALMHDIGKVEAGLGTYGRTIATVSGLVGGLDLAEIWQEKTGFTRKVGLYLRYTIIGAEMLELAGSDDRVIAWSIEHHLPEDAWSVPVEFGRILAAADE